MFQFFLYPPNNALLWVQRNLIRNRSVIYTIKFKTLPMDSCFKLTSCRKLSTVPGSSCVLWSGMWKNIYKFFGNLEYSPGQPRKWKWKDFPCFLFTIFLADQKLSQCAVLARFFTDTNYCVVSIFFCFLRHWHTWSCPSPPPWWSSLSTGFSPARSCATSQPWWSWHIPGLQCTVWKVFQPGFHPHDWWS